MSNSNNNDNNKESIENLQHEILSEDYPKYDISFKIIVIGNSGVGKSCLTTRATKNIFSETHSNTVGFEFFNFNIKVDNVVIKLQIWDTCGQEAYRSLITNFYRNASLGIIMYAVNDFKDIEIWLKELRSNSNPDVKVFLIGNKVDLVEERQIQTEEGEKLKNDYDLDYFIESSAKTGLNSQGIFVEAAKLLYSNYTKYNKINKPSLAQTNVRIVNKENKNEGNCQC